jgi:hypothetical protein
MTRANISASLLRDSKTVPLFIKEQSGDLDCIIEFVSNIFIAIREITKRKFLSDELIYEIYEYIMLQFDAIRRNSDSIAQLKSVDLVRFKLMTYMNEAKEDEEFEILVNYKNLFKLIFRK